MKPLKYVSVADTELVEAARYYEARRPGVGKAFLDAVREAGVRIQQNPDRWPICEKPVRSYRVLPFPYRLLYRELPDRIQVVAVAHLSRRPGYWKGRLP